MNRNSDIDGTSTHSAHDIFLKSNDKKAEILNIVTELSDLLDVGLDTEALSAVMDLLDVGIHPEAIAAVITELRKEAAKENAKMAVYTNVDNNLDEQD